MSADNDKRELDQAARRAGSIVTGQIDAIVERAERRAEELRNEAQRELGEAARRAGTIVTEQIDAMLAGARWQAEKIHQDAQRDAEDKRRAAVGSAQTLLERIGALERPLGELVLDIRGEMERVTGELGNGDHVDAQATALPAETDASRGAAVDRAPRDAAEAPPVDSTAVSEPQPEPDEQSYAEAEAADTPEEEPEAAATAETESRATVKSDPVDDDDTEQADAGPPEIPLTVPSETRSASGGKSGGRFTRRSPSGSRKPWRAKTEIFVTREGNCSVCQRTFMAGSLENLQASDWRVSGDVGLCPDCQSEGWQLPDGARLPFRRGGS